MKKFFRRKLRILMVGIALSMFLILGVRYHGITNKTLERRLVDAGAVYKNYGIPVRTVTLNSVIATDVLIVNGTTFTGIAESPTGNQFLIGVSDSATGSNLATLIDALDGVTATNNNGVITITGENGAVLTVTSPDTTFTIASNGITNTLIGATRDGNTFTVETELRPIGLDGAKGPIKGGEDISTVTAKISAKFVEISADLIKTSLPGSAMADYPASPATATHDEIRRSLAIADSDYLNNVVIIGRLSGSQQPVICGIENALSSGGFELNRVDNDEAGLQIEFTAHFDPEVSLDLEPWFVRFPKES